MRGYNIFIIEDDKSYGDILQYILSMNPDYVISRFVTAKECLANLHKKPDLITVDYSLPDMNGGELLKRIKDTNPNIPVIIISGQEDISVAVELIKTGANDYILKDGNIRTLLWNAVLRLRENQQLREEVAQLREEIGEKYEFDTIKGSSPAIKKIFNLIGKAVKTQINVSITGETGTGKELVAKAIHYNSDRKNKPFVPLNMAAIPAELLESELFGYEKGAFTGANARKTGLFEDANKGTLFLDEIGEMDLKLQSKLLRVLQEKEFMRVGGNQLIKFDVRLIVASHKDLAEEVKKGNFREDLYYRIMGLPVELPPLRERGADILLLAKSFLDDFCSENRIPRKQLSTRAKDRLMNYSFPGNIRELKAMMELAAVMSDGSEIAEADINFRAEKENFMSYEDKTLKQYTEELVMHYLRKYNNNVLLVADKLDIGKSTIYNMMHKKGA